MNKKIIIWFFSFFLSVSMYAQNKILHFDFNTIQEKKEKLAQINTNIQLQPIEIIQDSLIPYFFSLYQQERNLPGYRIQIISTSNRNELRKVKSEFLKAFPDIKTYEIYQQPYFKLRVGDFLYYYEAMCIKKFIEQQFPGAYIVSENKIENVAYPLNCQSDEK